jgi:Flp pilus assembly protein TadD
VVAENDSPTRRGRSLPGIWQGAILLASLVLFVRTVGFGWVFDDQMEIVLNSFTHSLRHLPAIFSSTAWAGSGMETYLYRPLPTATFALNHLVSGLEPWSFHLVNVLLHALVSLLVFRLGRLWGLSATAAGLGGLLFAVHPVHVEVVAAVFGRKDILAALFTLIMVLLHRQAVRNGGWRLLLPGTAYGLALLSKEVGIMALFLVLLHDWVLGGGVRNLLGSARIPRLYVSYVCVLLVYVLVRNTITGGMAVPETSYLDNPLVDVSSWVRVLTALVVLGKGLALQLLPLGLSPDYSFNAVPPAASFLDPRFLGGLLGVVLVGWSLFALRGRSTIAPLATAWYVATILPASNLLVTTGTIFGERLLYLPSVAFCLSLGGLLAWGLSRWTKPALGLSVGLLLALSLQTVRYSGAWKDDLSLFRWAVDAVPTSSKVHHKLGEELLRAGELGPALASLHRALEIAPDNPFAYRTLEVARRQVAEAYLTPAGDVDPARPGPRHPEVLYLLGQMSRERGDLAQTQAFWEEAATSETPHPEAMGDLGVLRLSRGDTVQAMELLTQAVALRPNLASAWYALARIHLAQGHLEPAREALREFLRTAGSRFPDEVRWAQGVLAGL